MRIKKNRLIAAGIVGAVLLIAVAGFIKFNFIDVPYRNNSVTYTTQSGEKFEAHYKTDDTVEVRFMEHEGIYLKVFDATRTRSASGARYESTDGRFVFWSKGKSAFILSVYDDEIILRGDENPNKPKEEWFAGKLVFGHESQTFQQCGEREIMWVSDPNNLIREKYESLTANKAPYTQVYAEVTGNVIPIGADEDGFASGFKKQLIVSGISMEPLEKHPACNNKQGEETIYYSEVFKEWRDKHGKCNTCTPKNGFGEDGTVDNIAWRELWLSLKDDGNESPTKEEVKAFFTSQYAEKSGYYPVHVNDIKGVFNIFIPVPKELKDRDFFDKRGALLATYDVIQHSWGNDDIKYIRHSSLNPTADEKKAKAYAQQTEIYVQDGHNLRLRVPQSFTCSSCYDFVFDHYGDPNVPYYISVKVNDDGTAEEIDIDTTLPY